MGDGMKTASLILLVAMALVTSLGWMFSWKAGRLKDQALIKYQLEAKQAIAEANKATSIANEQAAAANLELARLQAKMLPRRLTKGQQETFVSDVSSLAPQSASIWYGAGDKESENFSWEIASALNAAGWKVFSPASTATLAQNGKPFGSIPRLQTGVVVGSNKDAVLAGENTFHPAAFKADAISHEKFSLSLSPAPYHTLADCGAKELKSETNVS